MRYFFMADETNTHKIQNLFESCPHFVRSSFEYKNFDSSTGVSYPRFIIQTVNRIRKIDSDLETETRTFEKTCLVEERQQLVDILSKEDQTQLDIALATWEDAEQEYWVNQLGKIAALEILTNGKASLETVTKMAQLPEELYITATQICVKLANAVKAATVNAEQSIGVFNEENDTTDTPGPRKLILKKVK
jgi:hypothetical protein